jgi:gas vesicle protein GvpL/GvpF
MKRAAATPGTYVYCVISARKRPALRKIAGLPGTGAPRLLEVRPSRYLVVSDAPLEAFGEVPLGQRLSDLEWVSRAALAHDAVVERFLTADAVVPMKVFTIFTSDERALAQTRADWDRIEALLKGVEGHVEWGLRLMVDEQKVERKVPATPAKTGPVSGRDYLLAKRKQQLVAAGGSRLVRQRTAGVVSELSAIARDVRQHPLTTAETQGSRLLLDAAFLVPRSREQRFRTAVARQTRKLAPEGYAVHLSGPWPPYSFIERA